MPTIAIIGIVIVATAIAVIGAIVWLGMGASPAVLDRNWHRDQD